MLVLRGGLAGVLAVRGRQIIRRAIPDLEYPSAGAISGSITAGTPLEINLLANSSDSEGGPSVELVSVSDVPEGVTVTATSGSFPTAGTVTVDPGPFAAGSEFAFAFTIRDAGQADPAAHVSATATLSVVSAAATVPFAPPAGSFTLADANLSSGLGFLLRPTALPDNGGSPLTGLEYATSTDGTTWSDWATLTDVLPVIGTDYAATGTEEGALHHVKGRYLNSVGAGPEGPATKPTVRPTYPVTVRAPVEGRYELLLNPDNTATLTVSDAPYAHWNGTHTFDAASTAPVYLVGPTISGQTTEGSSLTILPGLLVTNDASAPVAARTYQVLRDGAAISGATGVIDATTTPAYAVTAADTGATLSVSDSTTDGGGTTAATSAGLAIPAAETWAFTMSSDGSGTGTFTSIPPQPAALTGGVMSTDGSGTGTFSGGM